MLEDPPLLTIRRNPPRLAADAIEPFRDCMTGWLADAQGGRGALDAVIKPLAAELLPGGRCVGSALTCWCGPNDNLALMAAVALARPGDVILVASEGFTGSGMVGDLVVGMARNRGVAALVTDGMVRDQVGIRAIGLPVFCRGVTPNSCVRNGPGTVGMAITIGGVTVRTGDLVLGDADGVVVAPAEDLASLASRVNAIRTAEARAEAEIRAGAFARPEIEALLGSRRVAWVD